MKKRRFEELHREALRLPYHGDSWDYIGNDPGLDHLEKAYEGEVSTNKISKKNNTFQKSKC